MAVRHHEGDLPEGYDFGSAVAIDTETMGLAVGRDRLDAMLAREGRDGLARAAMSYLPDRVRLDLAGFEAMDIFAHASP